jgi:hypothetical protein
MKLEELIQLVTNKKTSLEERRNLAYMNGDMENYYSLIEEISETEKILEKLNS